MLPGGGASRNAARPHLQTISSHGEDEYADAMAALGPMRQPAGDIGDVTSATETKARRSYVGGDTRKSAGPAPVSFSATPRSCPTWRPPK
jgi:hypothetical protein